MTTPIAAGLLDRRGRGAELYMDATDYEHELGNCTVALYASVEDLKASRVCVAECGIVAVRVEFLRVVEPGMPYSERGKETPNVLADRREPIGEASSPKGDGRAAG